MLPWRAALPSRAGGQKCALAPSLLHPCLDLHSSFFCKLPCALQLPHCAPRLPSPLAPSRPCFSSLLGTTHLHTSVLAAPQPAAMTFWLGTLIFLALEGLGFGVVHFSNKPHSHKL